MPLQQFSIRTNRSEPLTERQIEEQLEAKWHATVFDVIEGNRDDSAAQPDDTILAWRVKHKGVTIAALTQMPTSAQIHALADGDALTDITIHFETEAV